jgi:DNA-binding NarL/FixJ family response regulator
VVDRPPERAIDTPLAQRSNNNWPNRPVSDRDLPKREPVADQSRAVVIEGTPLVRAGLTSVLRESQVTVVAETGSGLDAHGLVRGTNAHLLVVGRSEDAELADSVGRVRAKHETVTIIALFSGTTREELLAVLDAGADAVLPQAVERDQLLEAIAAVGRGERYLSTSLTALLFAGGREAKDEVAAEPSSILTARERCVVRLLADGHSNDEISDKLFISPSTVKTHLSNVYDKLGAKNRYDAVVKATQHSLL